jgi:mannosidase alpha-like ER degradation enhancer 1
MSAVRRKIRGIERHQCPAYEPFVAFHHDDSQSGLAQNARALPYFDYAREQVSIAPETADWELWSPYGWCEKPYYELYTYDFILSATGKNVPEDPNPSHRKLEPVSDGYIMHNVTGIRTHIVRRLDGKGYDITKLGPINIRSGQIVYINDTDIALGPSEDKTQRQRQPNVPLSFFIRPNEELFPSHNTFLDSFNSYQVDVLAQTALFGADLTNSTSPDNKLSEGTHSRFGAEEGSQVLYDPDNHLGCARYEHSYAEANTVLLVHRGDCSFLDKLVFAKKAGAVGVIVVSDEDIHINPSSTEDELQQVGDINDVALVILKQSEAAAVLDMMEIAQSEGLLMVSLDPERWPATPDKVQQVKDSRESGKTLFLNGHPLMNTRLLF